MSQNNPQTGRRWCYGAPRAVLSGGGGKLGCSAKPRARSWAAGDEGEGPKRGMVSSAMSLCLVSDAMPSVSGSYLPAQTQHFSCSTGPLAVLAPGIQG